MCFYLETWFYLAGYYAYLSCWINRDAIYGRRIFWTWLIYDLDILSMVIHITDKCLLFTGVVLSFGEIWWVQNIFLPDWIVYHNRMAISLSHVHGYSIVLQEAWSYHLLFRMEPRLGYEVSRYTVCNNIRNAVKRIFDHIRLLLVIIYYKYH